MSDHRAVWFADVTKHYVGSTGSVEALRGVNLDVSSGEIFGLLGPNGAGKTTAIEIMVGLRARTRGDVAVLGFDPACSRDDIRARVSIQPQHASVFQHQTVSELLRVWASFYPDPLEPDELVDELGLAESRRVRISQLSGGQQQRVLVGLALVGNPQLLILDEPTTGLDPNARQDLWQYLRAYKRRGGTVLLSTHSMEEAERLCDRVAIMFRGKVADTGSPVDLIREHAPGREIDFSVDNADSLDALGAVGTVVQRSTDVSGIVRIRLNTSDSDRAIRLLSTTLAARDVEIQNRGLEDVFRRLTGHEYSTNSNTSADNDIHKVVS